jgi:hypothetical protein
MKLIEESVKVTGYVVDGFDSPIVSEEQRIFAGTGS